MSEGGGKEFEAQKCLLRNQSKPLIKHYKTTARSNTTRGYKLSR